MNIVWEAEPVRRSGPDDDLLTAGLGLEGLRNPDLPAGTCPRVVSIHKDFRDLVDISPGGRFEGSLKGGARSLRVPGTEHSALLRVQGLTHPFAVRLLMPDHFDWERPMIVVAPSSGSRGVTGAIGDIGAWALPEGCALVLTDKGTGGVQLLSDGTRYDPNLEPTTDPQSASTFSLPMDDTLRRFRARHPGAIALKHAHSQENVEAFWPAIVLAAAGYGTHTVLRHHSRDAAQNDQKRLRVLAAGVSNGGGAVLRAAEEDAAGVLNAVFAVEPNITPPYGIATDIWFGDERVTAHALPFIDYATTMNLLLPAALLAPDLEDFPFREVSAASDGENAEWATGLSDMGILTGSNSVERASDALEHIRRLGFSRGSEPLTHTMSMAQIWPAVCHTFINALGRFSVSDDPVGAHVCFAKTDSLGQKLESLTEPTEDERRDYGARSGGLSPGGGAFTIYRSGNIRPSLEDVLTFRSLASGKGKPGKRVSEGAKQVEAKAKSREHPTIILHGRCDPLINVNHTSRAYFCAAKSSRSNTENWRYYEHATGQHFESFLMIPGLSERFNPLQPTVFQALNLMRAHLFEGAELPPSQVIKEPLPNCLGDDGLAIRSTTTEGIQGEHITDPIVFENATLRIPK
ncbi:MAG: 3-hydroxybutyrate oligomer hydrolase family protein [Pseudomonadota bacterium]